MSKVLAFVDHWIGMACRGVLYLTLSVVFVILSVNVGLRYAAGTSLAWASELPELMFPWMIMAGVVLAAQHGSHIAVVLVTQKLGLWQKPVLKAGAVVVAVLYGGLAVIAWPVLVIAMDEKTPILQVPGAVSVASLVVGFGLLSAVTLCRLFGGAAESDAHGDGSAESATDTAAGPQGSAA